MVAGTGGEGMTAARAFCILAAAVFVVSCICYRMKRELAGDRLLFLAYGAVIIAIAALLKTRGTL